MSLLHARGFTYLISFNSLNSSELRYFHSHYYQVKKLGLREVNDGLGAHIASKWPNWNWNLDFSNSFHNEYLPHRICFCACKPGVGKRTFLQDGSEDSVKQHIKLLTHNRLWLTITFYSPYGSKSGQWFPYGLDPTRGLSQWDSHSKVPTSHSVGNQWPRGNVSKGSLCACSYFAKHILRVLHITSKGYYFCLTTQNPAFPKSRGHQQQTQN